MKLIKKGLLKKAVSILITLCLMITIANIPVYAGTTAISAVKTTDAVLSGRNYVSVKESLKSSTKTTATKATKPAVKKTTVTKKTDTKKVSVKKISASKVKNVANQNLTIINNLLKKKGINKTTESWLKKAKILIKNTLKSKKDNSTKYTWFQKALKSLKTILNASNLSLALAKETTVKNSIWAALKPVLKNDTTYTLYIKYVKPSITKINNLLKKNISETATIWLKEAKNLINETINGKKSNSQKTSLLKQALSSINKIVKGKASVAVLKKQSQGIFTPLREIDEIYAKYGKNGIDVINGLAKRFNLSQSKIYEIFKKNKVTKSAIDFHADGILENIKDKGYFFRFTYSYECINNAFTEINKLNVLNESKTLINNILSNKNTSDLAKSWLQAAQTKINEIINSNKKRSEKKELIDKAFESIQKVADNNCSIEVLEQESSTGCVFSSLQETVLEKSVTYKTYKLNTIITILINDENTSDLAKSWLQAAQTKIDEIISTKKTDTEKEEVLNKALDSLKKVSQANCSIEVLEQESAEGKIFSSLQESVLDKNSSQYQIYNEYGDIGVNVIKQLANKLSMRREEVFNIFKEVIGVTKEQMEKAGSVILDLLKKGETFVNCASFAVGAYLNIDINVAAVMNLASELSVSAANFVYCNENKFKGTNIFAEKNTLQENGINNVKSCYLSTFEDFMEGLKVGESAILNVYCYDLGGHAVTVKREENGYGVFDINTNNGKEIIYTPEAFKTLMLGERGTIVEGITADGRQTCSRNVYYTAVVSREIKERVTEIKVVGNIRQTITKDVWNTYDVIDAITNSNDIIAKARYTI